MVVPGHETNRTSRELGSPDLLQFVLAGVLLSYVWRLHQLFPIIGSLEIPLGLAGLATVLYILDTDPRRRLRDIKSPLLWVLLGFALLMAVGGPFALVRSTTLTFFTKEYLFNVILLFGLPAVAARSQSDLRWLAGVHLLGAIVFCLVVLTRYSVGADGRLGNLVYYDANGLGMLLVISLPLAVYFVLEGRNIRSRLLAGACLPIFILTLVKTGSRGAFIGLCVVALWMLIQYRAISLGRRLLVILAAFVFLTTWSTDSYWDSIQSLLTPTQDYNWAGNSETGRMEVWERGVGYMLDRPILGVGARNFMKAEGYLSERGQINQLGGPGFKWSVAHNSFIQVGAEIGVFGLLLFITLLFEGFRISGRSPPPSFDLIARRKSEAFRQALRVSLIGYIVTGLFLSAAYSPILYALLGLVAGVDKLDRCKHSSVLNSMSMSRTSGANRPLFRLVPPSEKRHQKNY